MDPIHIKPTWHEISLRQVAFAHKFYSTLMQRRRKLFPLALRKKNYITWTMLVKYHSVSLRSLENHVISYITSKYTSA